MIDGVCLCQGLDKPDTDLDGFCDAIDPCPEDWNAMPASLDVADVDDCPCPTLELNAMQDENPILENGNDFYLHLSSDLSGYTGITVTIDNGQPNSGQEASISPSSPLIIPNLTGGYTYTITITAYCSNGEPQTLSYTVDVPFGDSPIVCGVELNPEDLASFSLLPALEKGEEFVASDFTVNVREVKGSYGKFSGKGYISIAYFNAARLNVSFTDITISDERKLINGFIEIDGFGLALLGDDISDAIQNGLDDVISVLETLSEVLEAIIPVLENIEKIIEETGHLVSDDIKQCLLDEKVKLEELIALTEAIPAPSEAELAQIKLDIESVSAKLDDCKKQYDEAVNQILVALLTYYNASITNQINACSVNQNYEGTYALAKSDLDPHVFSLSEFVSSASPQINNGGGILGLVDDTENEVKRTRDADPNHILDPVFTQKVDDYFLQQSEYSVCLFLDKLNDWTGEGTPMTKIQMTQVLVALLEVGTDYTSIIGLDIKDGKEPTDIQSHSDEVFKQILSEYLFKKYYGE